MGRVSKRRLPHAVWVAALDAGPRTLRAPSPAPRPVTPFLATPRHIGRPTRVRVAKTQARLRPPALKTRPSPGGVGAGGPSSDKTLFIGPAPFTLA